MLFFSTIVFVRSFIHSRKRSKGLDAQTLLDALIRGSCIGLSGQTVPSNVNARPKHMQEPLTTSRGQPFSTLPPSESLTFPLFLFLRHIAANDGVLRPFIAFAFLPLPLVGFIGKSESSARFLPILIVSAISAGSYVL